VLVLDDPDEVRRKFKAAVTDSGRDIVRRQDKAGVTNLIEIMAAARGVDPEHVEKGYAEAPGYAGFKQDVGEAVVELLAPCRVRKLGFRSLPGISRERVSHSRPGQVTCFLNILGDVA
jgi:tryptophanyl-tRNA synthetase